MPMHKGGGSMHGKSGKYSKLDDHQSADSKKKDAFTRKSLDPGGSMHSARGKLRAPTKGGVSR